uniref:Putative actin-related protein n=1 Tax=uncultured organism TaxID=155900 RepID=A0A0F6PYM9_9ZZZZ|nr:putative actin-related protein [uncultured organism]
MQTSETLNYIIVDFGSQYTKIGFYGEGYPRFILPTVIAYKNPNNPLEEPKVSYNALYNKDLTLVYPFQEKTVSSHSDWNWRHVKELITGMIRELKVKGEDYLVFYIEPAHSNPNNTKLLIELLQTKFRIPKVHVYKQPFLIFKEMVRGLNKTSGLVIELGHTLSSITAFYKGYEIPTSQKFFLLGGNNLIEEFLKKIKEQTDLNISTYDLILLVNKYFYVPVDYEQDQENFDRGYIKKVEEILPVKSTPITIGAERFRFPEGLFHPELIRQDIEQGLATMIIDSINECPIDTRAEILDNVILSGGLSKLKGLDKRIKNEIYKAFPITVNINTHDRREVISWIAAENFIRDGLHDIQEVQERRLTIPVPETILQYYNEGVNAEKAELWIGCGLLIDKVMLAIYEDIKNRLSQMSHLKIDPSDFFYMMTRERIVTQETYKWGEELGLFRIDIPTTIKMENRTKNEIGDKLDFLIVFINEIFGIKE